MPKRSQADSDLEAINLAFKRLFAIAPADDVTPHILKQLKYQVLSAAAEEEDFIHKAATDFTLYGAVQDFGLTYRDAEYWWKIDELPDVKTFQPSACIVSLLENYNRIYDQMSVVACRIPVDSLLCECIAVLQGKVSGISPTQPTEDGRIPTPWDSVKVHCDVSFTHTINPIPTSSKDIVVSGRVDHAVGIVIRSQKASERLFHPLLLCIDAKFYCSLSNALAQLIVYLACLRQWRINQRRSDTSVYGVATDGLLYIFVNITHEGIIKESKRFDVMRGDSSTVLGCLRYILEMAMSMTPNLTLVELGADADDPIDLDDIPYLYHDNEE